MNGIACLRLRLKTAGYQEPSLLKQAERPFMGNTCNLNVHCGAEIVHVWLERADRRPRREGPA